MLPAQLLLIMRFEFPTSFCQIYAGHEITFI